MPPAGNFCMDKSYQKPLRGTPLKIPVFTRVPKLPRTSILRHEDDEKANLLGTFQSIEKYRAAG